MPGSIRGKLIFTYSAVIAVFLIITVILLNITARRYLEEVLEKNLYAESSVIEELYKERIRILADSEEKPNAEGFKLLIKEWFKDVETISKLGFSSNMAFVLKHEETRYSIFTPGETRNEANFKSIKSSQIVNNLKDQPFFFAIQAGENKYFSVSRPLSASRTFTGDNKAWLVVYVPVTDVNQLVKELNVKAAFAILVALIWASAFTYYFSGHFSKPIKKLKEHAIKIAGRNFKSRVKIKTGDEIESLAEAMNQIAGDLSDYDQAQKRLIQNISHELKTPVMSIMGYAEGMIDGVITEKDKALGVIVNECQRLKRLIDEVMFLSKLETLESFYRFEHVSMHALLFDCKEKAEGLLVNTGIRLDISLDSHELILLMDRDKIIQAIINLVSNAVRYAKRAISISVSHDEEWVRILVEDDGEGIKEEELPLVFERFYKGKKGHVGLGMTITKAIVEGHQGKITAGRSKLGGALFTISLPVTVLSDDS